MNEHKLMDMIGEAQEEYVHSALETRTRKRGHKSLTYLTRVAIAAAMVLALGVTAYAADFAGIKTLSTGGSYTRYDTHQDLAAAEKKAGFEIDFQESFDNGYTFDRMAVRSTNGFDEHGEKRLTYNEISVDYQNGAGHLLSLYAYPYLEQIPSSDIPAMETRQIGDIAVEFRESHYRSLPAEKEGNLTEEETLWEQQPGNYISYFSWDGEASESRVLSLSWTKDGVCYILMDHDGGETADVLYAMAEQLISK